MKLKSLSEFFKVIICLVMETEQGVDTSTFQKCEYSPAAGCHMWLLSTCQWKLCVQMHCESKVHTELHRQCEERSVKSHTKRFYCH